MMKAKMKRKHIKQFQVDHYAKADKRMRNTIERAKLAWISPYNSYQKRLFFDFRREGLI